MSDKVKAPVWFWIVAVLFLLWNGTGVFNYISQVTMSEEALAALDEQMRTMIETRPPWATASFAVAVWGGFLASILLLMRKSLATFLFVVSLIGVILNMVAGFFVSDAVANTFQTIFAFFVLAVSILCVLVSRSASRKGWIN